MAWPTTGAGTLGSGYLATGVTTLRWGSKALVTKIAGSAVTAGVAVVTRFNQRNLVDNIKLPNGDGLSATRVQIIDGVQWEVTIRDDTSWSALPAIGSAVVIVDAAGMIYPAGTGPGVPGNLYLATILDNGYDTAPKQPGERTLTLENLVLIESQTAQ